MILGTHPQAILRNGIKRVPSCATKEQYTAWLKATLISTVSGVTKYGFCTDCTQEYQAKMIRAGRCDNPKLKVIDET